MVTLFRLILGGIFLITGISKIPIFDAFAYSITELVPLSGTTLTVTAVAAIAFEIIAGLALLLNKGTRLFATLLSLIIISFIILLSIALFRYESYICTCFGVLGLKLPVNQQIIVDFVLLNMAVIVLIFNSPKSKTGLNLRRYASKVILPLLVFSIVWSGLVLTQPKLIFGEKPDIAVDTQLIFHELPPVETYEPRLVFMIDIADFLCPQCLEDFLEMGNTITGHPVDVSANVFIITKRIEFMSLNEQREFIEGWRTDYNYPLPLEIDVNNIFSRAGLEKSTILLYTALGSLEDVETLPMGSRRRNEIVNRFLR